MREEGIDFQQCTNAFLKCSNPVRIPRDGDQRSELMSITIPK
jgi:hypothetical protein